MDDRIKTPIKISGNIFEFLKYVKILDPLLGQVSFELWSHLGEAIWIIFNNPLIIILKARQIGFSWLLASLAIWTIYTKHGGNVLLISKGEREATQLLEKCKYIYRNLPNWLQIYNTYPDSASSFGFLERKSKITALPSTSEAGRGEAATLVICDEQDFHEYAEANFAAVKPTIDAGGQLILVSSVNKSKPKSIFKGIFKDSQAGRNNFKSRFYGWRSRPDRDDAWYETQKRDYPLYELEQEYPNSMEEALMPMSAQSVFDKDVLNQLWDTSTEPIEIREGFIHIFQKPRVGVRYVAGGDVGEGVGLDHSVLSIIGRYGGQSDVAAIIYSNKIPTDIFAFEIDKLCREYRNPLLGVENNSLGVAVINKLLELGTPSLFYSDKGKKKPGWTTSSSSKQLAIVELVENVNNGSLITRFKPQIQELMEYQWVDGKPEPTGSTHGDTVISLAIANQMLKRLGQPASITIFDG